jgi:hypothetical protein
MIKRLSRLFVIKTRFEAYVVIYALAVGGVERGMHYFDQFPGVGGYLLFLACTGTVFMAGAKILDSVPSQRQRKKAGAGQDRRQGDRRRTDRRESGRRPADAGQAPIERPA